MINQFTELHIEGWKGAVTPQKLLRCFCPEASSLLTPAENKRLIQLIQKAEVIGDMALLLAALNAAYEMGHATAGVEHENL